MQTGNCFRCRQAGHWISDCPLKLNDDDPPPPAIQCHCGGGFCQIKVSKTQENPGRKFYKCPAVRTTRFFVDFSPAISRSITTPLLIILTFAGSELHILQVVWQSDRWRYQIPACLHHPWLPMRFWTLPEICRRFRKSIPALLHQKGLTRSPLLILPLNETG